jgi:hypothetical protein
MADEKITRVESDLPLWEELRREEDARYDKLDERVRKLEKRGRILESMDDEKIYMWLFAAYIVFGFVIPLAQDFMRKEPKV